MRTESEVRAMIAEIEEIDRRFRMSPDGRARYRHNPGSPGTAQAVIAALRNVLDGPATPEPCGCMGPLGCCICQMACLEGRGPGWVAEPADMLAAAHEADREREAIRDQISRDWPEMAQLLSEGFADRLRLDTFRAIARDLKNTDW